GAAPPPRGRGAERKGGPAPPVGSGVGVRPPSEPVPPGPPPTTGAFVSRTPSLVYPTADPRLPPPRPPPWRGTRRLATLGVSSAATPATIWEYESSEGSISTPSPVTAITSLQ